MGGEHWPATKRAWSRSGTRDNPSEFSPAVSRFHPRESEASPPLFLGQRVLGNGGLERSTFWYWIFSSRRLNTGLTDHFFGAGVTLTFGFLRRRLPTELPNCSAGRRSLSEKQAVESLVAMVRAGSDRPGNPMSGFVLAMGCPQTHRAVHPHLKGWRATKNSTSGLVAPRMQGRSF